MTVTAKDKTPLVVPHAVVRRAGIKNGDELHFEVSRGVITISARLMPDELEDALELRDPKVREHIRKSQEEFAAGKGRPIEEFFAERAARARRTPSRRTRVAVVAPLAHSRNRKRNG